MLREARDLLSLARCAFTGVSLPAACETCDTAQLSPARAMLRTAAVAVQRTAHDTAYSLNYVQIAQKQAKITVIFCIVFCKKFEFFFETTIYCVRTGENALFSAEKHNILWSSKICKPVRNAVSCA